MYIQLGLRNTKMLENDMTRRAKTAIIHKDDESDESDESKHSKVPMIIRMTATRATILNMAATAIAKIVTIAKGKKLVNIMTLMRTFVAALQSPSITFGWRKEWDSLLMDELEHLLHKCPNAA